MLLSLFLLSVAVAQECIDDSINPSCSDCSLQYEPICVNNFYTACNACFANCESEDTDPDLLNFVPGECDNLCTQTINPCGDDLECLFVDPDFPFSFPGDTAQYRCVNQEASCSNLADRICVAGELQNPGGIRNYCQAINYYGIEPNEIEVGNCAHICDTDPCNSPSERCIPQYDQDGQAVQDQYRCKLANCACPPEVNTICVDTDVPGVKAELPNECVARCEGYTNWRRGQCSSSPNIVIINNNGLRDTLPGGTALTQLDDIMNGFYELLLEFEEELEFAQSTTTCGCSANDFDPVCVDDITFSTPCFAECKGYFGYTQGACVDPCNNFDCGSGSTCSSPFPGEGPICLKEYADCICTGQESFLDPVCVTVGRFRYATFNACAARCSGFDIDTNPSVTKGFCDYQFDPLEGLDDSAGCTESAACGNDKYCSATDNQCYPAAECASYNDAVEGTCGGCASSSECGSAQYCSKTDLKCYSASECASYNDAIEGEGQCPGCQSSASCGNNKYCSKTDFACYNDNECPEFNDAIEGSCPGGCQSTDECTPSKYCATNGECYLRTECSTYDDAIEGFCPDEPGNGGGDDDCCSPKTTTGCELEEVRSYVCGEDSFCCVGAWDDLCVSVAVTGEYCDAVGCDGGCCATSDCSASKYCSSTDNECYLRSECATYDDAVEGTCPSSPGNSEPCCNTSTDAPGCASSPALESFVCSTGPNPDSFCCQSGASWDNICLGIALESPICEGAGGGCGDGEYQSVDGCFPSDECCTYLDWAVSPGSCPPSLNC